MCVYLMAPIRGTGTKLDLPQIIKLTIPGILLANHIKKSLCCVFLLLWGGGGVQKAGSIQFTRQTTKSSCYHQGFAIARASNSQVWTFHCAPVFQRS